MSNSWQQFTVEEFFSQNNWSGTSTKESDRLLQEIPWLCQKIEDFFSHSNWQGEIIAELSKADFSLTLSVEGFFQLFAWDMEARETVISQLSPLSEANSSFDDEDDELDLDNFRNLF